jgi:hypothetical protein
LGVVTTSSETAFSQSPEVIYDFVTDPANWTKTYPHSTTVAGLPETLPLKVGDTWTESGPDAERIFTWHLAIAMRPKIWLFNSVGRLGHDPDGNGGMEGRITVQYHSPTGRRHHAVYPDDDGRGVQTRSAAGRLLPDGQSGQHRRLPRRDRARTRLTFLLVQRAPQRNSLEFEQPLACLPLRKQ